MSRIPTIEALQADPTLVKVVLARISGAWEGDGAKAEPEKPQDVCRSLGLSYGAFLDYMNSDGSRYELYMRALEVRALMMAEEIVEIADDAKKDEAHLAKLRIDARQRLIKSWHKRLYGDDPLIQVNQVITDPTAVRARIAELERRLGLAVAPEVVAALPAVAEEAKPI